MLLLSKHGGNQKMLKLIFLQIFFAALFLFSHVSCDGGGKEEVYYRVFDAPGEVFKTISYCKLNNQKTNTHGCLDDKNDEFKVLKTFRADENSNARLEARKMDLAVNKDGEVSKYSMIPFEKLGFPIFSRHSAGSTGWTFVILRMAYGIPERNNPDLPTFSSVHVYDRSQQCKSYVSDKRNGKRYYDYLGVVSYMNQKYNEYGWLFIKNKEHVCMFYAKFEDLYDGDWDFADEPLTINTKRVEDSNGKLHFKTIDNYPTQSYLKRFFAFDPLFGCFVSMYWDGNRNHDPEAHFFKFDESNPLATPELVYSYALPDFNKDLLQSILDEHFLDSVHHVFQSYGGQIFVFGRHPVTCNGFIGHYKDPYVYYTKVIPSTAEGEMDPNNKKVCYYNKPNSLNEVPLMYVKEDWITFTTPAYKMKGPIPSPTPPTSSTTSTTTSTTTTTTTTSTTTTTTEKPTTSSTQAPSSSSPVPTTSSTPEPIPSTEVSSTPDPVTQPPTSIPTSSTQEPITQTSEPISSSSTTSQVPNSTENALSTTSSSVPLPSNSTKGESLPYVAATTKHSNDKESQCSSYVDDCLWCLILLIIIDVLLLVVFIVLIVFERRGANQRKSEMVEETDATTAAETEMSKYSNVKSQKKSKAKKSQTETVGTTAATGGETTTIKKIDTVDDGTKGTKFFTVKSDFEKPSKKKKKAVGRK